VIRRQPPTTNYQPLVGERIQVNVRHTERMGVLFANLLSDDVAVEQRHDNDVVARNQLLQTFWFVWNLHTSEFWLVQCQLRSVMHIASTAT
jgi:hypothetical protein